MSLEPQSPEQLFSCPLCNFKVNDLNEHLINDHATIFQRIEDIKNTRHTQPPSVQTDDKLLDEITNNCVHEIANIPFLNAEKTWKEVIKQALLQHSENLRREIVQLLPYKDIVNQAFDQLKINGGEDALKYFKCSLIEGIKILQQEHDQLQSHNERLVEALTMLKGLVIEHHSYDIMKNEHAVCPACIKTRGNEILNLVAQVLSTTQ